MVSPAVGFYRAGNVSTRRPVLEIIERILALGGYSLEEIVEMLSPDAAQQRYSRDSWRGCGGSLRRHWRSFRRSAKGYDFNALLCLAMIEQLRGMSGISRRTVGGRYVVGADRRDGR